MDNQVKRDQVVEELERVIAEAVYPDRPRKFMIPLELAENTLALLKAQEPVKPLFDAGDEKTIGQFLCGKCHAKIGFGHPHFCWYCGRAVKFEQ